MIKSKLLLTVLLAVAGSLTYAQNETKRWYFGAYAGLNFNTNPPTIITTGGMTVDEGCTSMCDASGNLLFYGSATTIFNNQNAVMANGLGLNGHTSSSQGALAIKQPGSQNIYYYFTLDAQNLNGYGLSYSIIDMSLAAGIGSVTVKNIQLYTPSTEKMTAVKHCNGIDVWIMTHDWNSDAFRAYLLTAAGLNTVAVITNTGQVHTGASTMAMGCIKFSPSGHKLAVCVPGPGNYANVELYDFDRATGVVSNQLILTNNMFQPYGCEFSHDGSKLYAGGWYTPLYQWNVCAGSDPAIVASQYTATATQLTGMQMAPDGKIYVSRAYQQQLGVINNPNAAGAACNYVNLAQSVAPKSLKFNLPNFVTSYFDQSPAPPAAPPFTFNVSCKTAAFTAQLPPPVGSCTSPSYSVTNALWDFGDPQSGATNTSTMFAPSHIYPAPGTYTVKLILYRCKTDTLIQNVVINQSGPNLLVNGPTNLCFGSPAMLSASGASTYTWSTGATGPGMTVSPATNTVYSVTGTNAADNCQSVAFLTVNVVPNPTVFVSGPASVCAGQTATLQVTGADTYTWNSSTSPSSGSVVTVAPANTTTYLVTGINQLGGCQNSAVHTLTVIPGPNLAFNGRLLICTGESTTITASGASNYTWSAGASPNNPSVVVSPTINTTYTVTGTSSVTTCSNSNTVTITVDRCTAIDETTGEAWKVYYSQQELIIESGEEVRVTMVSMTGAIILQDALYTRGRHKLDMSAFSDGVYIVQTSGRTGTQQIKIIKQ